LRFLQKRAAAPGSVTEKLELNRPPDRYPGDGRSDFNDILEVKMSIIGWVVLGLIAGFVASKIVNKTGEGVILDIVLGIVGAIVGGIIFNAVGEVGVTGFNLWSMVVAVIGAIVILVIYHALFRRAV
jgi:uncharacterized membrane protein YeaQ/YmgE (transglycosylase-associated protein family)